MKMHILSGGRLRMRRGVYVAGAEKHETIYLPVACYLLRHRLGNVLFDTGCHPSTETDPEGRWGAMSRAMTVLSGPGDNLITNLESVGLQPEDIDVVVNSHFHTDHCGCNAFFRKATFICHAHELEAASQENADKVGYLSIDWKLPMPMETIDGQRDLFNDGRIVLVPLPGHTPGMTGALVALDRSGEYLLASDAVALRHSLDTDSNPRVTWDHEQACRSMAEVRRIEAGGATVLFGHDEAQWQTLRRGQEYYD